MNSDFTEDYNRQMEGCSTSLAECELKKNVSESLGEIALLS